MSRNPTWSGDLYIGGVHHRLRRGCKRKGKFTGADLVRVRKPKATMCDVNGHQFAGGVAMRGALYQICTVCGMHQVTQEWKWNPTRMRWDPKKWAPTCGGKMEVDA